MSINVHRFAELTADRISSLQQQLIDYYSNPPASYYVISDQAAEKYTPSLQPFHCDLVSRVTSEMSVLEIGCGSAHLCPQVEQVGASYTGFDYSHELLERNRTRFPRARFLQIGTDLQEQFDVVASLYTIEHIVDPPTYLEKMWNFCKPGGLLAIICPEFIDGNGCPSSFFYGKTPRRFREKVRSLAVIDAATHLIDLLWFAPSWKRYARASAPGAFWINMEPRIFHGAEYTIDADAVHLPRLRDIVWWLEKRGAFILETSLSMEDIPEAVLRYNCYVLARKLVQA